jgi:hypothetical protein
MRRAGGNHTLGTAGKAGQRLRAIMSGRVGEVLLVRHGGLGHG